MLPNMGRWQEAIAGIIMATSDVILKKRPWRIFFWEPDLIGGGRGLSESSTTWAEDILPKKIGCGRLWQQNCQVLLFNLSFDMELY